MSKHLEIVRRMQAGGPSPNDAAKVEAIVKEARPLIEAATDLFQLVEGQAKGISLDRVTINGVTFMVTLFDTSHVFEYWREELGKSVIPYVSMDALMDAFYCYMADILPKETKE